MFFLGYNYGSEKQLGYFKKADAQIEKEQKLIQKYRAEYNTQLAKQKAEAEGEDYTLYDLPAGLFWTKKNLLFYRYETARHVLPWN